MQHKKHVLSLSAPGASFEINAFHFGPTDTGRKVYMQASLHADELPGSLAAFHLNRRLQELEKQGALNCEIILVPFCNPIGLSQTLFYEHIGRFQLPTGQNFNRLTGVPLYENLLTALESSREKPGADAQANLALIRGKMRDVLDALAPARLIDELHITLLKMACDADVVLDLHCDNRAVMHVYSLPQVWDRCEPLARYLQSECQLLAEDSLSCSFDEMVSTPWLKLQGVYPEANIPLACFAATVELRGDRDLTHEYAERDALALIQYLNQQGYIRLPAAQVTPMPPLRCEPHPLGGLAYVVTPCAGIVVYHVAPGQWVQRDQLLAEIVDPVALTVTPVNAPVGGFIFATAGVRLAQTETKLLSLSSPDDIGSVGLSP